MPPRAAGLGRRSRPAAPRSVKKLSSDRILERLLKLHTKLIDLSLDRVSALLAALGNPQEKLPPVIHVAGTNGKGSTIAFLRACLEAAGYRVHVYTSPHLIRFHERIRLAGSLIAEDALVALLDEVEAVNAGAPITFFEITTAMAFMAFARAPADAVLLETGLGGRFDATNVIAHPVATVITPISLDHQHFLGETVSAIAFEKAGILKPQAPVVIGPQPQEAQAVLEARAQEVGAKLFRFGREWEAVPLAIGGGLRYRGQRWKLDLPPPGLIGRHQYDNAAAAIACLDQLDRFDLKPEALGAGLRQVEWPARLQRLGQGKLAALLPPGCELWLDGAHNAAGGAALAAMAQHWRDRKLRLIFGMLDTHDARAFLTPLAPFTAGLEAIAIPGETNSLSAEAAAEAARDVGIAAAARGDIAAAVREAGEAARDGRVLICGSLYLAGKVLAENAGDGRTG